MESGKESGLSYRKSGQMLPGEMDQSLGRNQLGWLGAGPFRWGWECGRDPGLTDGKTGIHDKCVKSYQEMG